MLPSVLIKSSSSTPVSCMTEFENAGDAVVPVVVVSGPAGSTIRSLTATPLLSPAAARSEMSVLTVDNSSPGWDAVSWAAAINVGGTSGPGPEAVGVGPEAVGVGPVPVPPVPGAHALTKLGKRRFNQFLRNVEAQCAFFVHGMRNRPIFSLFTSIF